MSRFIYREKYIWHLLDIYFLMSFFIHKKVYIGWPVGDAETDQWSCMALSEKILRKVAKYNILTYTLHNIYI